MGQTMTLDGDCPVCGETIGRELRGRPRIYCSDTCRSRAHRAKHKPDTVTVEIPRWMAEVMVKDACNGICFKERGGCNSHLCFVQQACRAILEEK